MAGLVLLKQIETEIRNYDRNLPTGKDQVTPLAKLPAMKSVLDDADNIQYALMTYSEWIANLFCNAKDSEINAVLVDRIACAKILNMSFAIDMAMKLKGRVGSYSLQARGPFGYQTDLMYVFQFAEGDSGILKQKMARDHLGYLTANPLRLVKETFFSLFGSGIRRRGATASLKLVWRMAGARGSEKVSRWLKNHSLVEDVAMAHCILTVRSATHKLGISSEERDAFDKWFGVNRPELS